MQDNQRPAVFMDRDGTLIYDKHYLDDPEEVEWIPGTLKALESLNNSEFALVIVTNQSGVGRGYMKRDDVEAVHDRIMNDLGERGVELDLILYEPYIDDAQIPGEEMDRFRRKPRPGMLHEARDRIGVNLERSFMIGDKQSDLEAGNEVGATPILVRTGKGTETEGSLSGNIEDKVRIVDRFSEAAEYILSQ
ncbi:MAG: D-glycero-alpha-D-manno-heptose-1,7-bisphosphate 7-phosphatase [bacterium]